MNFTPQNLDSRSVLTMVGRIEESQYQKYNNFVSEWEEKKFRFLEKNQGIFLRKKNQVKEELTNLA